MREIAIDSLSSALSKVVTGRVRPSARTAPWRTYRAARDRMTDPATTTATDQATIPATAWTVTIARWSPIVA